MLFPISSFYVNWYVTNTLNNKHWFLCLTSTSMVSTNDTNQEDHTTSCKEDKEFNPNNRDNANDYDVQKHDNRTRIISMPTPSNFVRVSRDSFWFLLRYKMFNLFKFVVSRQLFLFILNLKMWLDDYIPLEYSIS